MGRHLVGVLGLAMVGILTLLLEVQAQACVYPYQC